MCIRDRLGVALRVAVLERLSDVGAGRATHRDRSGDRGRSYLSDISELSSFCCSGFLSLTVCRGVVLVLHIQLPQSTVNGRT
eukprot:300919-Pyramimonas_sp.AAC.1